MSASSTYHLYMCCSKKHHDNLLLFDMLGIGVMIFGLTLTAVYVGFHNYPTSRLVTMLMMSGLFVLNLIM